MSICAILGKQVSRFYTVAFKRMKAPHLERTVLVQKRSKKIAFAQRQHLTRFRQTSSTPLLIVPRSGLLSAFQDEDSVDNKRLSAV